MVIVGVTLSPLGAGMRGLLSRRKSADSALPGSDTGVSSTSSTNPDTEHSAAQDYLNTPPPLITDKPSIAVLPFVNMSKDEDKEFFADGMTEDIITGLSCDSRLFVIARNSTFAYKGQSPDIRTVGKELGVRYVLEGSLRPINDRLRITAQLIETETGSHVWAEKIDRPAAEIFDIMDEVVDGIVITLCANIRVAESDRAGRQRPEDVAAWALCVRAETLFISQPDSTALSDARNLAQRATEIEPGYAASWALLALLTSARIAHGLSDNLAEDAEQALFLVGKGVRLAPNDPIVLCYCGFAAGAAGQSSQGVGYLERSLDINPNNSFARLYYGVALYCDTRLDDSRDQLQKFIQHSPRDLYIGVANFHLALCYVSLKDFEQAEHEARVAIKHTPGFGWNYLALAMALSGLGRDKEAQAQIQHLNKLEPALTRQRIEDIFRLWIEEHEHVEQLTALLRQAWPES